MNCSSTRIRNAWIADGSGSPLFRGDVLVVNGRIQAVERDISGSCSADSTVDARGLVLSPGFIDVHGHSDMSLLADSTGFSKVSQGVTMEVAGNCGLSVFPVTDCNNRHLNDLYAQYGVMIGWSDYAGCQKALEDSKVALRLPCLCGHNTLRAAVLGYGDRRPDSAELSRMCGLLERSLEQGALGMSMGLLYVPGKFAERDEIVALMRVLARHDSIVAVHLRSEGDRLLESMEEILEPAAIAGLRRVHISHFKTSKRRNWDKLDDALALIGHYRSRGMLVTVDRYPYVESMTQLSVVLPDEWEDMDDVSITRALDNPKTRRELYCKLLNTKPLDYWKTVRLVSCAGPHSGDCGKFVSDIGDDPAAVVVEILSSGSDVATASFCGMSRDNMMRILDLDFCMAGSDGNALPPDFRFGKPHPRAFGAVAKFLRLRLDAAGDVASAVHRVTGLAASTFQLADAGRIAVGAPADLTCFDPDEIDSKADFISPCVPADGVVFTMKGGSFTFRP
ncbi:MAG: amidohydrolase family protein [Victivallaceae bacterium]|nr:amidohydrolase family protein [Victivallaceae bacterium]